MKRLLLAGAVSAACVSVAQAQAIFSQGTFSLPTANNKAIILLGNVSGNIALITVCVAATPAQAAVTITETSPSPNFPITDGTVAPGNCTTIQTNIGAKGAVVLSNPSSGPVQGAYQVSS